MEPSSPILSHEVWTRVCQHLRPPLLPETYSIHKFRHPQYAPIQPGVSQGDRRWLVYHDVCSRCMSRDLHVHSGEGVVICGTCGEVLEHDQQENQEPVHVMDSVSTRFRSRRASNKREFSPSTRKQQTHFRLWLKRVQAKDVSRLSGEQRQIILAECQRRRVDVTSLDFETTKSILRHLKMKRSGSFAYGVTKQFNPDFQGICALSRDHEDEMMEMFGKIQEAFPAIRGRRSNMLSYRFIIKKLFEAKQWFDLAEAVPTFKSAERLYEQDRLWKRLCPLIGVVFRPTAP